MLKAAAADWPGHGARPGEHRYVSGCALELAHLYIVYSAQCQGQSVVP